MKLKKIFSRVQLNGPSIGEQRIPNNLNLYFPGYLGADLIIKLDLAGFSVSAGSACSARVSKASYVLTALGLTEKQAKESIRITIGKDTTEEEIKKAAKIIKIALKNIS
jgi:cysteine desulfurase